MRQIDELLSDAAMQGALTQVARRHDDLVELAIRLQQIAAPTFHEQHRAAFVHSAFNDLSLADVHQDALNNVYGRLPGAGKAPPVVVSAHLDTVFGPDIDLAVRREDGLIHGPGIGDNATGLAGMLMCADIIAGAGLRLPGDVWFVANVCEEGLGDLKGMRAVADRFGLQARYIVVEGGVFGYVYHAGIGVSRFRIAVETPGGHSWGAFGAPSAVHVLGRLIAAIADLSVPSSPRTTFNVGVIEGGTTVNTIAQRASLLLDLRSEDSATLAELVDQVNAIVTAAQRPENVQIAMEQVGNRPAGRIDRDSILVRLAAAALEAVRWTDTVFEAGSTDANIPLSRGWEAVCIGLTRSGNAHRTDEFMDPRYLDQGLQQLLLLTAAAAGYPA